MFATGVGLVLYGAKHQDSKHLKIREDNIYRKVTLLGVPYVPGSALDAAIRSSSSASVASRL